MIIVGLCAAAYIAVIFYCWLTAYQDEKKSKLPQTNADKIRNMTDEELAIMASTIYRTQELIGGDVKLWIDWLKQKCEDDKNHSDLSTIHDKNRGAL